MERSLRMKTVFLLVLVALSCLYMAPTVLGEQRMPSWLLRVFNKKVKLGLDLQGGLHLVYRIDFDKAVDDKAGEVKRDLETKLADKKIEATVETPRPNVDTGVPLGAVIVTLKEGQKLDPKFFDDMEGEMSKIDCPKGREGALCFRVATDFIEKIKGNALDQAIKTIRDRVDRSGVADPTIIKKGDDIVVELPGTDDKENERLREIINRTAQLEFKIADDGSPEKPTLMSKIAQHVGRDEKGNATDPAAKDMGIKIEVDQWNNEATETQHTDYYLSAQDRVEHLTAEEATKVACGIKGKVAVDGKYECLVTGRKVLEQYIALLPKDLQPDDNHMFGFEEMSPRNATQGKSPQKTWRTYYLWRAAELTGTAVDADRTDVTWDQTTNRPEVSVTFTRAGGKRFGEITSKNVGRRMAIILDDKITSAPSLQTAILDGRARITLGGGGDANLVMHEAQDLVTVLRTGALPAPLVESQSSQVGALLGQDAIDRAKLSMGVGALLVVLLMLFFYKVSGVIANVAMVLNVLFQVAILTAFQARLTLPGIAGLVLTIGMAVDSNIIIYERIREELRSGKSVRGAVDAGFGRAFWTVFDAHVTNFIAGIVLVEYGTGPIRGFAYTLLIGVVCNLFTSTWVSRLMFDYYVGRKRTAAATISI